MNKQELITLLKLMIRNKEEVIYNLGKNPYCDREERARILGAKIGLNDVLMMLEDETFYNDIKSIFMEEK